MLFEGGELTLFERCLARAFTIIYGLGSALMACLLVASVRADFIISRALEGLPELLLLILAGGMGLGAFISISGALHVVRKWEPSQAMMIEFSGCLVLMGAWAAYSLSVLLSGNQYGTTAILMSATAATVYLAQMVGLLKGAIRLIKAAEHRRLVQTERGD